MKGLKRWVWFEGLDMFTGIILGSQLKWSVCVLEYSVGLLEGTEAMGLI